MTSHLKLVRTPAEEALAQSFEALLASEAAKADGRLALGNATVIDARRRAMAEFLRDGLPHRRIEAWKYTDLRTLLAGVPPVPPAVTTAAWEAADAIAPALDLPGVPKLLSLDGAFLPSEAIPVGVDFTMLSDRLYDPQRGSAGLFDNPVLPDNPLVALNRAFFHSGAAFTVADKAKVETPLHVARVVADRHARFLNDRLIVDVGAQARLTVVESRTAPDGVANLFNTLVEFRLGEGAEVDYIRFDAAGSEATSLSTLAVLLGRGASFRSLTMPVGYALSRHQVFARFEGADATLDLRGAALLRGRQHLDTTLVVDHIAPHGVSRELFRTVLDEDATGIFQGRINVAKDAQKTDGRMASNALMLSDRATMNNKPELEIFADDVQCAHGATCGALDDDLLFYLMARGIPRRDAEGLMIRSFVGEAIDGIDNGLLRDALGEVADRWLAGRR
jgi:Fe-S cluster assembly protein SufD